MLVPLLLAITASTALAGRAACAAASPCAAAPASVAPSAPSTSTPPGEGKANDAPTPSDPPVAPTAPVTPVAPAAPNSGGARAEQDEWADRPLIRRPMPAPAFLLPGAAYTSWSPIGDREARTGGGLELSAVKWLPRSSFLVGAALQVEYVGRARAALGVEVGYDVVGLELALARDFAKADAFDAQWSLQLATYVSVGALYLAPRWLIPLQRSGGLSPGYGALLTIGFKLPIVLSDGRSASAKPAP